MHARLLLLLVLLMGGFATANLGDLTGDGSVGLPDLLIIVENIGQENYLPAADINQDGVVDILDLVMVARLWGTQYEESLPPQPPVLAYARASGDTTINLGNGPGEHAQEYQVHVSTTAGFTPSSHTHYEDIGLLADGTPYPHTIKGLEPETTYYVRVLAINAHGMAASVEQSATTLPAYTIQVDERPHEPPGFTQVTFSDWSSLPPSDWTHWGGTGAYGEQTIDSITSSPFPGGLLRQSFHGGSPSGHGGGRTRYTFNEPVREVYISTWYYIEENLLGNPVHVKMGFLQTTDDNGGHHMHGSFISRNAANLAHNPPGWFTTWGIRLRTGWSITAQLEATAVEVPRGEWFHIEYYLRYQDMGEENGVLRVWQNGVELFSFDNITIPGEGFASFRHEGVHGGGGFGPPEDTSYAVGQTYISIPG